MKSLPWRLVAGALLFGLGLPPMLSCSLSPVTAPVRVRVLGLRDNPELSGMTYFAVVVSGSGLSPTVNSAAVGGRAVDCLKLDGSVSFPYTLAQLVAGVSISMPLGTYRISIVGYSDSAGSPGTIGALFSGSPSLRSYLIAQSDFNTVASQVAQLPSAYVKASATELVAACPRPASALYGTYVEGSQLKMLKKVSGAWSVTEVVAYASTLANLAIDASGFAHLIFANNASPPVNLPYATNTSGTFAESTLSNSYQATYPSDIAIATNGTRYVVNVDPGTPAYLQLQSKAGNGAFILENAALFINQGGSYASARIVAGPQNRLLVMAASSISPFPIYVRTRDELGNWSSRQTVTSAGAFACSSGAVDPHGVYDGQGNAHFVFRCYSAASVGRVGYAHNRSGSFQSSEINGKTYSSFLNLTFSTDGSKLHILFSEGNSRVQYLEGDAASGTFAAPVLAFSAPVTVGGISMATFSSSETRALLVNLSGAVSDVREYSLGGGNWTDAGQILSGINSMVFNERLVAR